MIRMATDMLDVLAEIIALMYHSLWTIEIFFRHFKHVLGCRHLLSHSQNGIEFQVDWAIVACLLISGVLMIRFSFSSLMDVLED